MKASNTTQLRVAMTGKASEAKAAEGDEPVFAHHRAQKPRCGALAFQMLENALVQSLGL